MINKKLILVPIIIFTFLTTLSFADDADDNFCYSGVGYATEVPSGTFCDTWSQQNFADPGAANGFNNFLTTLNNGNSIDGVSVKAIPNYSDEGGSESNNPASYSSGNPGNFLQSIHNNHQNHNQQQTKSLPKPPTQNTITNTNSDDNFTVDGDGGSANPQPTYQ